MQFSRFAQRLGKLTDPSGLLCAAFVALDQIIRSHRCRVRLHRPLHPVAPSVARECSLLPAVSRVALPSVSYGLLDWLLIRGPGPPASPLPPGFHISVGLVLRVSALRCSPPPSPLPPQCSDPRSPASPAAAAPAVARVALSAATLPPPASSAADQPALRRSCARS